MRDTERNLWQTHNLCLYCRANKHLVERCQLTKGQHRLNTTAYEPDTVTSLHHKNKYVRTHTPYSAKLQAWRSPTDFTPRIELRRPQLKVKGSVGGKVVHALVDSGAEDNFINKNILQELQIQKSTPLSQPIIAADGHIIMPSDKARIVEIECKFNDLAKGQLSFVPAPLKHQDVILGYPWLQRLNPNIDWITGKIECKNLLQFHSKRSRKYSSMNIFSIKVLSYM